MPKNAEAIYFTRINGAGERVDTCIPPGFAEVHESGLVLSFVLMDSDSIFGEAVLLDERTRKPEELVRKIGGWIGVHFATLQEGKFYRERTGERLNLPAMTALNQLNHKLISWVDAHIPRLTEADLGYFNVKGELRFKGKLYGTVQK
ncbi:hypothetical protein AB0F05_36280 [Streptomyces microflavus]|uniref:hypothetical protein n=1 Tax=Streptomyces microflavus TaxID=1919 RepID=UPI0033F57DB6